MREKTLLWLDVALGGIDQALRALDGTHVKPDGNIERSNQKRMLFVNMRTELIKVRALALQAPEASPVVSFSILDLEPFGECLHLTDRNGNVLAYRPDGNWHWLPKKGVVELVLSSHVEAILTVFLSGGRTDHAMDRFRRAAQPKR